MAHDEYLTSPHLLIGQADDISIRKDIGTLLTDRAYSLLGVTAAEVRALRGARRDRVVQGFLLMRFHLSTRYESPLEQRKWALYARSGKLPDSRSESKKRKKSGSTWGEIAAVVFVDEGEIGISHQAANKRYRRFVEGDENHI